MNKEICKYCKLPIAGESQWRGKCGFEGYSTPIHEEWCWYPDQCEAANKQYKEARNELIANTRDKVIDEIVAFLNKRAGELYNLGGVHIRESVALGEAAILIDKDFKSFAPKINPFDPVKEE
jgi:hypothetical protein